MLNQVQLLLIASYCASVASFLNSPTASQNVPKLQYDRANLPIADFQGLRATAVASDEGISETFEADEEEDIEYDDESGEGEQDLVAGFIEMILQETPRGKMKPDDLDLLREVMTNFPAATNEREPANVVESLLYRLMGEWEQALREEDMEKEQIFRPVGSDFQAAIIQWEKSNDDDKVVKVLALLSDQRELFEDGLVSVRPNLATINSVMRTLASSRERELDRRATVVFSSIGDFGLAPDADSYNSMISIHAKSRSRGAAGRAEKLLREGLQQHPPRMLDGQVIGISQDSFNNVVIAYAKSREENGPEKAEEIITLMDQIDTDNGSLGVCSPNVNTFTSLIDAYSQRNEWESASQADRMLNRLLEQHLEGNTALEPNIATWTIVINAWSRLSRKNRHGAAERAGRLLKRMEDLYQDGKISCKPDAIAYVTCMNAYAFSKGGNGALEAEQLLDEMNENYLDGDDSMKPSARSVRIVLDSYVKNGDMIAAEDLLDKYEEFLDSDEEEESSENLKDVCKSLLFGYTQSGDVREARNYLEVMLEKNLKPDCSSFDRVIDANTRTDPETLLRSSQEVFQLMEKSFQAGDLEPNERAYTTFIRALTKGKAPAMHKKADILLHRMKKLYDSGVESLEPTIFTYNAVLFACSETLSVEGASKSDAFKLAVKIFSEVKNNRIAPDHVTFGNMIRCSRLLPDGEKKSKFVETMFRLCCDAGCVNNFVLRDLEESISEDEWRNMLNCAPGSIEFEDLPYEWWRTIDAGKNRGKLDNRPKGRRDSGRRF